MLIQTGQGTQEVSVLFWFQQDKGELSAIGAYVVHHNPLIEDLRHHMEEIVRAYLKTPEGKSASNADLLCDFSWGDAFLRIPSEYWATHGISSIRPIPAGRRIVVDHDQNLAEYEEGE